MRAINFRRRCQNHSHLVVRAGPAHVHEAREIPHALQRTLHLRRQHVVRDHVRLDAHVGKLEAAAQLLALHRRGRHRLDLQDRLAVRGERLRVHARRAAADAPEVVVVR